MDASDQGEKKNNNNNCRQNATKGCHRQTAEREASTSKGKCTNTKLLAPSANNPVSKTKNC